MGNLLPSLAIVQSKCLILGGSYELVTPIIERKASDVTLYRGTGSRWGRGTWLNGRFEDFCGF